MEVLRRSSTSRPRGSIGSLLVHGWACLAVACLAADSTPFHVRVTDRATIDRYQTRHYSVESVQQPSVEPPPAGSTLPNPGIRVVRPRLRDGTIRYRSQFSNSLSVLPSYRAAILDRASDRPPIRVSLAILTATQRDAAAWVESHLATDGLLPTLAEVVRRLGPETFAGPANEISDLLRQLGLPVDLLGSFAPLGMAELSPPDRPLALIRHLSGITSRIADPTLLREEVARIPFRFVPAADGFQVSTESGEQAIAWLRLQAGGGYRDGIVPGGSIDVIRRLVEFLPEADFLVSVPAGVFDPFTDLARRNWTLSRTGQATLLREVFPVSAWAQDNGKPGTLARQRLPAATVSGSSTSLFARSATLVPRFASMDEGRSMFAPGESFLADSLVAAGHPVVQSSLLFQGGNLIPVQHPRTGRRLLLVGDGEIHRNAHLGLNEAQILEAFRVEFGVDECVVLPGVSYHLDYDLSVRAFGGELVALLNDPFAAARQIVFLGIEAFGRRGLISAADVGALEDRLRSAGDADILALLDRLDRVAPELRRPELRDGSPTPPLAARWGQCFVAAPVDSSTGNLQVFLLALDLLEIGIPPRAAFRAERQPERANYLEALRRSDRERRRLEAAIRQLGWRVVLVPSTPDLHRGVNYLNGIQHRDGFVMPAFGGFYRSLDSAAEAVIRDAFKRQVRVLPVLCAESQRNYGGIHCLTAVYPRTPTP